MTDLLRAARQTRALFFLPLLVLVIASGCQDKTSSVGGPFYPDTLATESRTITDTAALKLTNYTRSTYTVAGLPYNLTEASPMMIVGRVSDANENMESWGAIRFPVLQGDTLSRVTAIRLVLKTIGFKYGDTTSNRIDLQVYGEGAGKVNDSTLRLTKSDLTPNAYGSFQGDMFDSSYSTLSINLDTSIKAQLSATSFALVLVPGQTMVNCRGFAAMENAAANASSVPQLVYTVRVDTGFVTVYRNAKLDLHFVMDNSVTPPNEFTIRGGVGQREHTMINLTSDSLHLTQFTTINNAELLLHLDPANSRHSNLPLDTVGPVIVEITGSTDTSTVLLGNGVRDAADPTLYRFQLRTAVESWLRFPAQNFGVDLRAGYSGGVFSGTTIGVEYNTVNRWTFYGSNASDPTKRPQLVLSYSNLK